MSNRLLRPDPHRQKIISLTRTERWLSVIRHHSDEVHEVNLEAACRFAVDRPVLRAGCGLFAATDFCSLDAINALAVAGYQWTCCSPLAANRLFRQIQRYHDLHPPDSLEIESAFGQRLPWKAVGRYAGSSFKRTRFSNLPVESTRLPDSLTDAEKLND